MRLFVVAGETSGDRLAAGLVTALRALRPDLRVAGVGGPAMALAGVESLFPLSDIAVNGLGEVLARLPLLRRRVAEAAAACVSFAPDALVIVDAPDFTHRVARRARRAAPRLPIVDYVSPTVWAWRPGRARAMREYVDLVLALLPFEPAAHERLGGPRCVYVGHAAAENPALTRAPAAEATGAPPLLLLAPGSRASEVARLMPVFGETFARLAQARPELEAALPVAPHVGAAVARELETWRVQPRLLTGEAEKYAAFRRARAALAACGTVTLELALAGVPFAAAYRVSPLEERLKFLVKVPSAVLPNLVLGRNVAPEYLHGECRPERLAPAVAALLDEGPARTAQLAGFEGLAARLRPQGRSPSQAAAAALLELV